MPRHRCSIESEVPVILRQLFIIEIWGFHVGEDVDVILGFGAV
jgi:hypothetical protein